MKRLSLFLLAPALLVSAIPTDAQAAAYAPASLTDFVLTSTPSVATGSADISMVFSANDQAFTVGADGSLTDPTPFNYAVTGPNTATITIPANGTTGASTTDLVFTGSNAGTYSTSVAGGATTTGRFTLEAGPVSAPLANVSVRSTLAPQGSTTVGFVVGGSTPRRVLIRAIGPGLAALGVANPLSNPLLTLFRRNQPIASNSDWGTLSAGVTASTTTNLTTTTGTTMSTGGTAAEGNATVSVGPTSATDVGSIGSTTSTASAGAITGTLGASGAITIERATNELFMQVGAFPLAIGSKDAALVATLPPGPYTVTVTSSTGSSSATGLSTGSPSAGLNGGLGSSSTTASATGTLSSGTTSSSATPGAPSLGGSSAATGSSTSTTPTSGVVTTNASGDVLVEVYFVQ